MYACMCACIFFSLRLFIIFLFLFYICRYVGRYVCMYVCMYACIVCSLSFFLFLLGGLEIQDWSVSLVGSWSKWLTVFRSKAIIAPTCVFCVCVCVCYIYMYNIYV